MGCMLGCFGLSSKRKRRKPPSRILPRDQQGFGSYEQLDNSASADIEFNEETVKKQAMEPVKGKIRKKVSFNLNVMAYEPISSQDDEAEDGKTEEIGNRRGTTLEESPSSPAEEDPTATKMVSYPSNYRYRDCIDNYDDDDEEEEFYDESDLDSDEDYEEEEEEEAEGGQLGDIEEVRRRTRAIQDEQVPQHFFSSLQASSNSGKWQEKNDQNARERSQYIHSVLNPVENLAQWKEIKARGKQQQKKENTEPMLLPVEKVVVASSLSNWLASPPVNCQPKTGVDKSCARSWRSREESLGMTDITNLSN